MRTKRLDGDAEDAQKTLREIRTPSGDDREMLAKGCRNAGEKPARSLAAREKPVRSL